VFQAAHNLTTHDVDNQLDDPLEYSLDRGESECIWLANELGANFFLTDEFNSTNYLFINLALEDRNILFTTPHILCTLATQEILPSNMFQLYLHTTSKPKVGMRSMLPNFGSTISGVNYPTLKKRTAQAVSE